MSKPISTRANRPRIIIDTTDERKCAISEAAALQGTSITEWFDEQLDIAKPDLTFTDLGGVEQPRGPEDLLDAQEVYKSIVEQDWSFTSDDTRYLTHDIHPYPAKFIPQIPAHLIARLSLPGDVVFDPFGGSATTAVEAVRLGRRAISNDANPLSALIGRVKTGYMSADVRTDLEQLCSRIESYMINDGTNNNTCAESLIEKFSEFVPDIPNIDKWFEKQVIGELALVRYLISQVTEGLAQDAALVALSRIVIRVSNQDSETRYVSVPKEVACKLTLKAYLDALKIVIKRLEVAATALQFSSAKFIAGDSRSDISTQIAENSVELIVSSPPYPNATDYHLYHRFRLFWLGFDPRMLGKIEIGSHLRHQRNNSGFEEYENDMFDTIKGCYHILSPGRYAVFVVGDAVFKGEEYSTSDAICRVGKLAGFEVIGVVERPVHKTKRSFAKPGRRARSEHLVVLQKPNNEISVTLSPPNYKMWPYEQSLRALEINCLSGVQTDQSITSSNAVTVKQPDLWRLKQLAFSRSYQFSLLDKNAQPTWQCVLENTVNSSKKRKDPKYVTHGIHPYKGKFYPQLAKSLINLAEAPIGGKLLDPYSGSGTTLLEGMLNGYRGFGCDFNPLAVKIARAKTSILTLPRDVTDLSIRVFLERLSAKNIKFRNELEQFDTSLYDELFNWFPEKVLYKLNWILSQIRLFGNETMVDFFEVILSSLIREVSHQDPQDLRIRKRKQFLDDAPVFERYAELLDIQYQRLKDYWAIAGLQPGAQYAPHVENGSSSSSETYAKLGLVGESIDCVVTSPPYATALPYIDTDRLSLLAIMGIPTSERNQLQKDLTGSREINKKTRDETESSIHDQGAIDVLPDSVVNSIRGIYDANNKVDVGFRRKNMPALLWRYFLDMKCNLQQVQRVSKVGAKLFYVVGDSKTKAGDSWTAIETCRHIAEIGQFVGLEYTDSIDIDVTTENLNHLKNAITKNQILVFTKL
ncbi:hypothetical protein Rhal01_03018 [Rubritalea halochordaticola]|uniref:site-specific DNA-methyltransferase (cytosine-N(4)-specific) n=1 Tax=Rubritalea halochordaticola TaxID=714537 RepID=A0ABP9V2E1_9BACT